MPASAAAALNAEPKTRLVLVLAVLLLRRRLASALLMCCCRPSTCCATRSVNPLPQLPPPLLDPSCSLWPADFGLSVRWRAAAGEELRLLLLQSAKALAGGWAAEGAATAAAADAVPTATALTALPPSSQAPRLRSRALRSTSAGPAAVSLHRMPSSSCSCSNASGLQPPVLCATTCWPANTLCAVASSEMQLAPPARTLPVLRGSDSSWRCSWVASACGRRSTRLTTSSDRYRSSSSGCSGRSILVMSCRLRRRQGEHGKGVSFVLPCGAWTPGSGWLGAATCAPGRTGST